MMKIATVHFVILVLFTLGTAMLTIFTVSNVLRLRHVEISWKSGKFFGYPLFSTLFLCFSLILTGILYWQQAHQYMIPMLCYNWIGLNWFISSYLMSKRFVTDHGIVKNINDTSQTVSWSRIIDYVEQNMGKNQMFIFFYPDYKPDVNLSHNIRLELEVPKVKQSLFARLVQKKLGRRFSLGEFENTGIEQLR